MILSTLSKTLTYRRGLGCDHIHLYWEGDKGEVISDCHQSIIKNAGCPVYEWDEDSLPNEVTDLVHHLKPQFRSDYYRMWLLHQYGGLWLDSDHICTRRFPFRRVRDECSPHNLCLFQARGKNLNNAELFAPKPELPILSAILGCMNVHLRLQRRPGMLNKCLDNIAGPWSHRISRLSRSPYIGPILWRNKQDYLAHFLNEKDYGFEKATAPNGTTKKPDFGCSVHHLYHDTVNTLEALTREERWSTYGGWLLADAVGDGSPCGPTIAKPNDDGLPEENL